MKLQVRATEDAIASTAMSLRNSCLEGNKLWGGSFLDNILDGCEELLDKSGFWRLFGVEDMDFLLFLQEPEGEREGRPAETCMLFIEKGSFLECVTVV